MSFKADSLRVMIASPSDLAEERKAAAEAINDWNAQHAEAESVVLLPIMWETHAKPATGVRPQEAINEQLVAQSDILVGMFWTKIGTSTGVAESGTIEEVDKFVNSCKPALLYFSARPLIPVRSTCNSTGNFINSSTPLTKRRLSGRSAVLTNCGTRLFAIFWVRCEQ
jgi:Domain of unknown function (DUF4062)